jgi:site-specific recombinase XerD
VLAIPSKRCNRSIVTFLTEPETKALIAAPDRAQWIGRRDHARLLVAVQTGLRVSELTHLACQDVYLGPAAYIRCRGKGRKGALHATYGARAQRRARLASGAARLAFGSRFPNQPWKDAHN